MCFGEISRGAPGEQREPETEFRLSKPVAWSTAFVDRKCSAGYMGCGASLAFTKVLMATGDRGL
jgi:hypothetical protein